MSTLWCLARVRRVYLGSPWMTWHAAKGEDENGQQQVPKSPPPPPKKKKTPLGQLTDVETLVSEGLSLLLEVLHGVGTEMQRSVQEKSA